MKKVLRAIKLVTAVFILLDGCRDQSEAIKSEVLPSQIVREFRLEESISGRKLYSLSAVVAVVWENEGRIDVENPQVFFYDEQGSSYSLLTAISGTVWTKTEDLIARGNVVVKTADSTTFTTDSLAWSNSRRVIYTDADVVIETSKGRLAGSGLVSDAQLNKIEMISEVHGQGDYEFAP